MSNNIETEYKFVVKKPSVRLISSYPSYTESEILQIYLENPLATHRVRRRAYSDGRIVFTENKKRRINKMSSYEDEREISEREFEELRVNIERGAHPLKKIRRTVEYGGLVFEFDFYEKWKSTCIMEVELPNESAEVKMPEFVEIVRDVTGDKSYSNHSMAHSFPDELV